MGGGRSWRTRCSRAVAGIGGDGRRRCSCGSDVDARNNGSARGLASQSESNHQSNNFRNGGGGAGRSSESGGGMLLYDSLSMSHKPMHIAGDSLAISSSSASSSPSSSPPRGVAWYICGPTVYDAAHVGHGRTYVTLDILRRVAMQYQYHHGPGLLYVMNITDVDDKIIKRSESMTSSSQSSESPSTTIATTRPKKWDPIELARHYEGEFWSDMDQLNVLRPNVICRVSEHVESTIVPYVAQILEGGMAYVVREDDEEEIEGESRNSPHGSVYFDVRAFESKAKGRTRYGKLAPDATSTAYPSTSNGTFFSWEKSADVAGGVIVSGNEDEDDAPMVQRMKRDPRDFCLWKRRRTRKSQSSSTATISLPDNEEADKDDGIIEPESVSYNSPWGPGRPGWHVECSAMIHRVSQKFQDTHAFAMHAGGIDLRFPHHTNEIAQAEAHCIAGEDGKNSGSDAKNDGRSKEWIQHWLHTGHLHVKGRKMSKSLKNFITIREMLQLNNDHQNSNGDNHNNNAWHSPSDDFRLWCLGLSGSYRGPATYGKERMEEARTMREKWVRFLIEGQECLEKWMEESRLSSYNCSVGSTMANNDMKTSYSSTRLWEDDDLSLFRTVALARIKCHAALMNDLDGAAFVRELTHISETGLAYVHRAMLEYHSTKHRRQHQRPEEPLRFVLDCVRFQLDLVGFSPRTVNAGLGVSAAAKISPPLLDEAVVFRAAVRSTALNAIRQKEYGGSIDALKDILGLCDKLRDDIFPTLGIEILDDKVAMKEDGDTSSKRGWRHCPPRGSTTTNG